MVEGEEHVDVFGDALHGVEARRGQDACARGDAFALLLGDGALVHGVALEVLRGPRRVVGAVGHLFDGQARAAGVEALPRHEDDVGLVFAFEARVAVPCFHRRFASLHRDGHAAAVDRHHALGRRNAESAEVVGHEALDPHRAGGERKGGEAGSLLGAVAQVLEDDRRVRAEADRAVVVEDHRGFAVVGVDGDALEQFDFVFDRL